MVNLAVGRPAPEIEGTDMDGKPLRLSDYKGKVVVLVFWGTWCGPCMALVPQERELVARLKDQPFALLGVDCKDDRETARKAMAREGMTWPSWYDGAADRGPIAERYHVRGYPIDFRDRCQRDDSAAEPLQCRSRSRRQAPGRDETPNSSSRCVAPRVPRKMKSVAYNTVLADATRS